MRKTTVVIVDDHALIRDAWTIILEKELKFQITAKIGNSAEVESGVRNTQPDVVLLDINMSPVDGFEVLPLIREISPSTRVIAVSMHNQVPYVKKMMKLGASGYITKNSPAQELLEGIETVLKGSRYISKDIRTQMATLMLDGSGSEVDKLTHREIEVINYLREGLSSREIANRLSLTVKTIEVHRHNILKKLNVKNSIAAIQLINARGLFPTH